MQKTFLMKLQTAVIIPYFYSLNLLFGKWFSRDRQINFIKTRSQLDAKLDTNDYALRINACTRRSESELCIEALHDLPVTVLMEETEKLGRGVFFVCFLYFTLHLALSNTQMIDFNSSSNYVWTEFATMSFLCDSISWLWVLEGVSKSH